MTLILFNRREVFGFLIFAGLGIICDKFTEITPINTVQQEQHFDQGFLPNLRFPNINLQKTTIFFGLLSSFCCSIDIEECGLFDTSIVIRIFCWLPI